jgi:hypothetical protein
VSRAAARENRRNGAAPLTLILGKREEERMTFPNDPGPVQRRQLSDKVSRKGWIFAGIIVVVAALLVLAFVWAGNDHAASSSSNPPAATTGTGVRR